MTETSEQYLLGSGSGAITPGQINPQAQSYNGTDKKIKPLISNNSALYVSGSTVRELGYSFQSDGYSGDDLTTFAAHLFEGRGIKSWAKQSRPFDVVWIVLDDGSISALTFIKEQQIIAWHPHYMLDGFIEDVCVCRENGSDAVYLSVQRTVDGVKRRYLERMSNFEPQDVRDYTQLDSCLTYDGRNTDTTKTLTLSTSTNWESGEVITVTSSEAVFSMDDVGRKIHFFNGDTLYRLTVNNFTPPTCVS